MWDSAYIYHLCCRKFFSTALPLNAEFCTENDIHVFWYHCAVSSITQALSISSGILLHAPVNFYFLK